MNCSALTIWLSQPCWYQGIGVAGTNRATVWAELLSSGYSTATRINTMGDVTGCQDEENDWRMSMFSSLSGCLHQNVLNRFWLSSVHFPVNFHPSNGFFRSFQGWLPGKCSPWCSASTLRSLHDAWTPGKFVLAFNGVLSNTSHLVLRCDRCRGVERLFKRYTLRLLMDFQVGMRTFGPYLL